MTAIVEDAYSGGRPRAPSEQWHAKGLHYSTGLRPYFDFGRGTGLDRGLNSDFGQHNMALRDALTCERDVLKFAAMPAPDRWPSDEHAWLAVGRATRVRLNGTRTVELHPCLVRAWATGPGQHEAYMRRLRARNAPQWLINAILQFEVLQGWHGRIKAIAKSALSIRSDNQARQRNALFHGLPGVAPDLLAWADAAVANGYTADPILLAPDTAGSLTDSLKIAKMLSDTPQALRGISTVTEYCFVTAAAVEIRFALDSTKDFWAQTEWRHITAVDCATLSRLYSTRRGTLREVHAALAERMAASCAAVATRAPDLERFRRLTPTTVAAFDAAFLRRGLMASPRAYEEALDATPKL